MANEILKLADAQAILDSAAKAYQLVLAAIGTSDAEANTLAKAASNMKADVLTHTNDDSNLWLASDLGDVAEAFVSAAQMGVSFIAPWKDAIIGIERHVMKRNTAYSSINDWMSDVGLRVHPYCRTIYNKIAPANIWPLTLETTTGTHDEGNEIVKLGTFTVSGAAAGTLSATTAISTSLYGDALIKCVVTPAGGIGAGSDIACTINGKDFDGSSVQASVTITAGSAQNTEFDVSSIRFSEITSVAITNGTAVDAWDFVARDDRTPTL